MSYEVKIAKNYLSANELKILNNLVSGYFDFAEIQALKHRPMYMEDYIRQLDNILMANGEGCFAQNYKKISSENYKKAVQCFLSA